MIDHRDVGFVPVRSGDMYLHDVAEDVGIVRAENQFACAGCWAPAAAASVATANETANLA